MNQTRRFHPWLLVALAGVGLAACTSIIGVEEAHVDPTFSEPGTPTLQANEPSKPAVCKPFDNAARLEHLGPDGELTPLPGE